MVFFCSIKIKASLRGSSTLINYSKFSLIRTTRESLNMARINLSELTNNFLIHANVL